MIVMKKNLVVLAFFLVVTVSVEAQRDILQVVTKTVEKHFVYKPGYELNVEGEKALVTIDTWDKDEIFVTLELISKHTDARVAEKDLESLKYVTKRIKNKIYLRNFLPAKDVNDAPIASTLIVRYKILLPNTCPVYIKNHFGEANVSKLKSSLKINSEYSKVSLQDIIGILNVSTRFGDLVGQRIDGSMAVTARRSDITLTDIRGHFDITAQYGAIFISSQDELLDLNIDAKKSNVVLSLPDPRVYGYELSAKNGRINLPDYLDASTIQRDNQLQKVDVKPGKDYYPSIKVSVTIGDIKVEKTKI